MRYTSTPYGLPRAWALRLIAALVLTTAAIPFALLARGFAFIALLLNGGSERPWTDEQRAFHRASRKDVDTSKRL